MKSKQQTNFAVFHENDCLLANDDNNLAAARPHILIFHISDFMMMLYCTTVHVWLDLCINDHKSVTVRRLKIVNKSSENDETHENDENDENEVSVARNHYYYYSIHYDCIYNIGWLVLICSQSSNGGKTIASSHMQETKWIAPRMMY